MNRILRRGRWTAACGVAALSVGAATLGAPVQAERAGPPREDYDRAVAARAA